MSELPRTTISSLSSSPGRLPPISRPDWPWAARSYSQRSQQSSPHPIQGSSVQSGWDPRSSISSGSSQSSHSGIQAGRATSTPRPTFANSAMAHGELTRHWTFTGFEWVVRDVHKLRNFVEGVEAVEDAVQPGHGDFEILKHSPMLGDNKFKLEIAPTIPADGSPAPSPTTLSLFITSLLLDFAQGDYETHASMMAAIKCQDDRAGERGARPDWVWEYWQNDWVFRRESEVWECPLPSLSSLLQNPRVQETDSVVICVQIHCPVGPSVPQQPSVYYVPKDLLDGLEASLDNPNTGDVRFVCLERYKGQDDAPSNQPVSPNTSETNTPFASYATARKRIIYAHSDILKRRSEYFATMLSSAFAENPTSSSSERKVYTVVVEDVDFETTYWLLKYCYANWLLFKQHDDPRVAVDGVGAGWSVRWLTGQQDEWDWRTFHREGPSEDGTADNRSATSGENLPVSSAASQSPSSKPETFRGPLANAPSTLPGTSTRSNAAKTPTTNPPSTPRQSTVSNSTTTSTTRRTTVPGTTNPVTMSVSGPSSTTPSRPKPVSISTSSGNLTASTRFPVSPRTTRPATQSNPDPHPHPTPVPAPASAISIYQVAHRYEMPNLAALALDHIMSTITPQSSFALLLATSLWDDLHNLIEDFVVERWDEVSTSPEFEVCCQEVAAGEWGPEGGKTLMSVFRRLRSPASLST